MHRLISRIATLDEDSINVKLKKINPPVFTSRLFKWFANSMLVTSKIKIQSKSEKFKKSKNACFQNLFDIE